MASTFLDLASDALTAIGQLGAGRSMSPEQAEQGMRVFNRMIGKWSLQRLLLYVIATRQYNLSAGTQDYTIGPTGTIGGVSTRPTLVESANVSLPGSAQSFSMSILDKPKWNAIGDRGATTSALGLPQDLWPEYTYPNLAIHVWPIPNNAAQLQLGVWEALTEIASIYDVLAFPVGYEEGLMWNLALNWAPFFDAPTDQVAPFAVDGLTNIKKINAQSLGGALDETQTLNSPNVGKPQEG